jgi:diphthamide synthase subunit DPH2
MIFANCFKNVEYLSHVYLIPEYSRVSAEHFMKKINEFTDSAKKKKIHATAKYYRKLQKVQNYK